MIYNIVLLFVGTITLAVAIKLLYISENGNDWGVSYGRVRYVWLHTY